MLVNFWFFNRLEKMSVFEVFYRIRIHFLMLCQSYGVFLSVIKRPNNFQENNILSSISAIENISQYCISADEILLGKFDVFKFKALNLGFPPQWNRDPKTGISAPLIFGKMINYRDEKAVGDIKYLWEPNRHIELVTLAQAWHLSKDLKYAQGCKILLSSWLDQCPYPLGVNWTSSLEHGIRLLNWAVAWQLLGGYSSPLFDGENGQKFQRRWLDAIFQHCHFIAGHFSKYSSGNNHLLGEYMGLFIGALMWPCWAESSGWLKLAMNGFESEALKQNAPDGVNREQALWYHHEVTDMMFLCGLAAKENGLNFSDDYWERIEAMLDFIASVMDISGNVPMIGDSDDGRMVNLSREENFNVYRSLLATGAVLFGRADFAHKAGRLDDKSRWLLGAEAVVRFDDLLVTSPAQDSVKRLFPDGGYCVLGSELNTPNEIRILAKAGPLGYLSIAAHGHADALSFTLSVGGHPILIDPGTFAYHTQQVWRDYFRGTSAHNTIRVDAQDQSVSGGSFMWLKHAKARCLSWESNETHDRWLAEHDGYLRLSDPVRHQRQLMLDKIANRITVTDNLECKHQHMVEMHWHFSETCSVFIDEEHAHIDTPDVSLLLRWPNGLSARLACGEDAPPMGWISKSLDVKIPSKSVVVTGSVVGAWQGMTTIEIINKKRNSVV